MLISDIKHFPNPVVVGLQFVSWSGQPKSNVMLVVFGIMKHFRKSIISNISNFNESVHKLNLVISEVKTDVLL